jgi:hypothetical protein
MRYSGRLQEFIFAQKTQIADDTWRCKKMKYLHLCIVNFILLARVMPKN